MHDDTAPAYYALRAGHWRDYVTLLHVPYTVWHLSYVVMGATAAPVLHQDRLGWTALAFFLAVGVAAHTFDELHGRPLRTRIPSSVLGGLGGLSLAGAVAVGGYACFVVSFWVIPLILFGGFIVLAYNFEWWRGRFHSDFWFSFAWGAFPVLAGYLANAETIRIEAVILAAGCLALTLVQRKLSTQARTLRRKVSRVHGLIEYKDGHQEEITVTTMLIPSERALRYLSYAGPLLALGWLVARWA